MAARSASRTRGTSLPEWEAPQRWERAEWLRRYSAQKSVKLCGLAGNGAGDVTVQRSKSGAISFGGTMMCGSRICPVCGPRIAADDKSEIERVLDWWLASKPSRRLLFGTFTLRHNRGQKYGDLMDAAQKCWQAATGGRGWLADRQAHGIAWTIRVVEEKWSPKHGWHVHVHVLFLVDDELAENPRNEDVLLRSMYLRWARRANTYGLGVPLLKAQDLHAVGKSQAAARLARYFSKQTTDAGEEEAESLALEMTGGARKEGRRSLTAGQIMAWAIRGESYVQQLWGAARKGEKMRGAQGQEYALMLWKEYEAGRKNRRIIAWSHGLRDAAGVGPELTEAEQAERQEAADAAVADTLVGCSPDQWRILVQKRGRRAELAAFAVEATPSELVRWFAERGLVAKPYRADRVGVRFSGPLIGSEAELYEKLPERMPF